ncbi:nucleosome assembly protein 1-like 1 isoform X1 [Leptopilina boulardi]|uniref:nucleosome assembly protein 1-like 1 isoform X1 n=3 Tax=Leptopilina boulardi TaxID=63433 RepID=UPI0021F51218|nr:nucleosome assembly protein 1-like 1 isoform X1 [Leptopilina boulardi]XP_051172387.1 nucleosome assembly protein 1-like 1 isoform X1 [Leptopilina boulardi]
MTNDPERTGDPSNMGTVEDEADNRLLSQICQNFDLSSLQGQLDAHRMEMLPAPVKRRIKALKQLQLKTTNIEAKFFQEVHELECKYYKMCVPIYDGRSQIISGVYEPTDEECVWESDDEDEGLSSELKNKVKIDIKDESEIKKDAEEKKEKSEDENIKGIPDFWLTIFKNVGMLADIVQEHDEPILKHLYDVKVIFLEKDPMGFVLEFHFEHNEYFTNSVLTKEYIMKCEPEKNDPFSFEGPEIYKSKGCVIDWRKGKNVTVKTIKKNQKHKSRGSMRTVTKTVQNDSFFNFFSPPVVPDDQDAELDDDTQALVTSDFEIGHYIRERIVPRAVLYYTGEVLEDEEDDDYEEDEEDDEDDVDDEDDAEEEDEHNEDPVECKQQ